MGQEGATGRWRTGRLAGKTESARESIGRGHWGRVYLAERCDAEFERRVAIKLVHPAADSPGILHRFRTERQLLATLDHPNIARLIDGGSMSWGQPYIVMEYVDGVRIDSYCDSNRLDIDRRLQLFCAMCEAVHYAHRNLVVHRDLKPGNILVDREGQPKLLDFGIAKLLAPGDSELGDDATDRPATTHAALRQPGTDPGL